MMIYEVYCLLGDRVTPSIVTKDLIGQTHGSVTLEIHSVAASAHWSLADEVRSQSRVQSFLNGGLFVT